MPLFCRTWPTFCNASPAAFAHASGILSVHSLTSAHYLNPRSETLDAFSIEWLRLACRHGVEFELVTWRACSGRSGTRREEVLHLLRLPRHRQLQERLSGLQRPQASPPACFVYRGGVAGVPQRRAAACDHARAGGIVVR